VGVIGLGGLATCREAGRRAKADVTVFTTSPSKVADVKRFGAREGVLWSDAEAMSGSPTTSTCDLHGT